ncbi:MAG: amidohydrolase family protein [Candidatus Latescibacterota bacterium]
MAERADAHIHCFEGRYPASFTGRPGVQIGEPACYASLARDHGVSCALIVGYAAADWCRGNNEWLARQVESHPWMRPLAHVDPSQPPTLSDLARWQAQGFRGLVMYPSDPAQLRALEQIGREIWTWLVEQGWLLSVNSGGEAWLAWRKVLDRHGALRLLISHLGLPPRVAEPPTPQAAAKALAPVLALAAYPGPHVKLSGFYALSDPGYDYPHRAAWPYVEALLAGFGVERLLWASDFFPALDHLSFPQTFGLFRHMPFLDAGMREAIEGGNLLRLLGEA